MSTDLVVDPLDVAARLGLHAPTPEQFLVIEAAVRDAQDAVEAELNRPIVPVEREIAGLYPLAVDLMHWKSWDLGHLDDDYSIVGYQPARDGSYTVAVKIGLDGANTPAIRLYVKAHAEALVRNAPDSGIGTRQVTSLSAEGQSISYAAVGGTGADAPAGTGPTLASLRAFKLRGVRKTGVGTRALWPYGGARRW